jgi:integral membrane sensor domain MASE1
MRPPTPSAAPGWARNLIGAVLVAVAYLAAAGIGWLLSPAHSFATFWPPSGFLVAALLLDDRHRWPWIISAAFAANVAFDVLVGHGSLVGLCYSAGNSLEALAGAVLVRRFVGLPCRLATLREVGGFVALSALASTTLSATIGAATTVMATPAAPYWPTWQLWWVADVLGVLLIAPPILTWMEPGLTLPTGRRLG